MSLEALNQSLPVIEAALPLIGMGLGAVIFRIPKHLAVLKLNTVGTGNGYSSAQTFEATGERIVLVPTGAEVKFTIVDDGEGTLINVRDFAQRKDVKGCVTIGVNNNPVQTLDDEALGKVTKIDGSPAVATYMGSIPNGSAVLEIMKTNPVTEVRNKP